MMINQNHNYTILFVWLIHPRPQIIKTWGWWPRSHSCPGKKIRIIEKCRVVHHHLEQELGAVAHCFPLLGRLQGSCQGLETVGNLVIIEQFLTLFLKIYTTVILGSPWRLLDSLRTPVCQVSWCGPPTTLSLPLRCTRAFSADLQKITVLLNCVKRKIMFYLFKFPIINYSTAILETDYIFLVIMDRMVFQHSL